MQEECWEPPGESREDPDTKQYWRLFLGTCVTSIIQVLLLLSPVPASAL